MGCFPLVEMEFNEQANLVERLICPSAVSDDVRIRAEELAVKAISSLNLVGVLAVELFVDENDQVWVNESAPRPHNSGHHSIESVITSQFEQHLRAIFNFSLGSTHLKLPAVMINLLGEPGYEGLVKYEGLTESMGIEGVKLHLYGKKYTKPFRKMGHVTILAANVPYEITIVSAHRTPARLYEFAGNAHERGIEVIIAGAGGAAHLPGMAAAISPLPVIGVPIRSTNSIDGWDSVLSILQMPGGVPVATVALNGAKNAGLLAVQVLSVKDPSLREKMIAFKLKLADEVMRKVEKMSENG